MRNFSELYKYYRSFISQNLLKTYLISHNNKEHTISEHLDGAAQWLCSAQDATEDDGVSRSYSLIYQPYFKRKGWFASYPETTGYIIPTMFDYARITGSQEFFDRAVRMAEWESRVQMGNGAVQGGTADEPQTPAIFNTGQVIFGWLRAYRETGKDDFLESAVMAGEFLLKNQEKDGSWQKNLSQYANKQMPFYTYNTRSAWAMFLLGSYLNKHEFKDCAIRNANFALGQQLENGWFKYNCLNRPGEPLLHTIAYCIRGLLEIGVLSGEKSYLNHAQKTADALLQVQQNDGGLAGRYNSKWEPTVNWSCLTGDAQTSIIWLRLYQITGNQKYLNGAIKINTYLRKRQLMFTTNRNIYGGITGSDPISGDYGKFEILNWAVKFFMDALLLEKLLIEKTVNPITEKD